MLSTVSAVTQAEPLLGNPFTVFHGGFTPWENLEPFFSSSSQNSNPSFEEYDDKSKIGSEVSRYHTGLDSGSDITNQKLSIFNKTIPSHDNTNQNSPKSDTGSDSNSTYYSQNSVELSPGSISNDPNQTFACLKRGLGSDDPNDVPPIMDDRKRRRMISNRESARRSRMRKQRHLENLRDKANRAKTENRECTNRLQYITEHLRLVRTENDRLRAEGIMLQRRLMEFSRIWQLQQLQQNYSQSTSMHGHARFDSHQTMIKLINQ